MRIESYIQELLYEYNCVVVPGFGAFLAHGKSAEIDVNSNTLIPPGKTISFNAQLSKNDGLLISHIAKEKKLGYESLLNEVEQVGEDWMERMKEGEHIELFGIGKLWLNGEKRIQFQPENKINYLTSSFGLATFAATPIQREVLKEEVEQLEEKIPFIITPEKREETSFRPWLKYAAVILLAVSFGFTGYKTYGDFQKKQVTAQQDAQVQVSRLIQEATFFDSSPLELPALSLEVKKKSLGSHHVIAGAFRIQQNAEKKIAQLKRKGFNAFYLGENRFGLHQVAYDSFEDPKEALVFLKKVKRTDSPDAWLLSEK
ncbi:SPOR domain-containing protein [Flagellimonas allohymeniacidonis]|uniref:SPOR domain-containing protein n=1 Tax=Flagellimonas allohymeniacidonis TaxID=2517819 RepID=A0A4Q8QAZ4_9FLAO|nr:SPOR domain-containing protein [Allomuricauda hymeniacidonis]TAI47495.1 SPOR domain-containing protein [Allomuricauda hymeniacidonis]